MHLHVTLLQSIYLNIFNGFSWQSNVDITPINYSSFYFSAPHQFILLCHWTKWRNCINHIITTLSLTPLHLHFLFLSLTAEVRYENVISQSSKFPVYLKNEISQGLPSSARLHCSCFFFFWMTFLPCFIFTVVVRTATISPIKFSLRDIRDEEKLKDLSGQYSIIYLIIFNKYTIIWKN